MLLAAFAAAGAEPISLEVRHRHLRKGAAGTLAFTDYGVRFDEHGKKSDHSRTWKYSDFQQFELAPDHIRVRTYEDIGWQAGKDREYLFDRIGDGSAAKLYPLLAAKLDQRFVAEVPAPAGSTLWEAPAKLLHRTGGYNGTLKIAQDAVVFQSARRSRTWRLGDIDNFSSAGPFELTLTSLDAETRFQLKQPLPEDRYNDLWRHFQRATGPKTFQPLQENHHE